MRLASASWTLLAGVVLAAPAGADICAVPFSISIQCHIGSCTQSVNAYACTGYGTSQLTCGPYCAPPRVVQCCGRSMNTAPLEGCPGSLCAGCAKTSAPRPTIDNRQRREGRRTIRSSRTEDTPAVLALVTDRPVTGGAVRPE